MNQLAVIEKMNPVEIFGAETLDQILRKISDEAKSVVVDVSTEPGRKEIASMAYKIARSKTFIDDLGKKLGEDAQAKLNAINKDRRKVRDFLDTLKDEVRKPLTDWELAEKTRVAEHEREIAKIIEVGSHVSKNWQSLTPDFILGKKEELESMNRDWQEFAESAESAIGTCALALGFAHGKLENHLKEQEELARFRAAEAERKQRERDEQIAAEAAERARLEAERKAKIEADRIALEAERERKKILDAKLAAEKAAEDAIRAKAAAEQKAEADRQKAAKDSQRAIEEERQRVERARLEAEAAERARENNRKHAAKINNEAMRAIVLLGADEALARSIVSAMATGKIPHVKITY